jgi:hypothetical protein
VKAVETRPQSFTHRGLLAVHAAKRWAPGWRGVWVNPDRDDDDLRRYDMLVDHLGCEPTEDVNGSGYWTAWTARVPLGAIVGTVDVIDCVPVDDLAAVGPERGWVRDSGRYAVGDDQIPLGDFANGRHALLLANPRRLPRPVPCKGSQARPWTVPDDIAAQVREQLPCGTCGGDESVECQVHKAMDEACPICWIGEPCPTCRPDIALTQEVDR